MPTMPSRRFAPYQRKNPKRTKSSRAKAAHGKSSCGEPWTFEEDEQLRAAVFKHGGKKWKLIATFLENRTAVQCNERWNELQNFGTAVKRPWTEEEDARMVELVEAHGPLKWSVIASYLPGRNGKQCRERWHNQLNPAIKKGPWTHEEDEIIMQMQAKYGNKWAKITEKLPGRTDNAVKNHWHSSMKARAKQARAAASSVTTVAKGSTKASRKRRSSGKKRIKRSHSKEVAVNITSGVEVVPVCSSPDDVADLNDLIQDVENPDEGLFSLEEPIVQVDGPVIDLLDGMSVGKSSENKTTQLSTFGEVLEECAEVFTTEPVVQEETIEGTGQALHQANDPELVAPMASQPTGCLNPPIEFAFDHEHQAVNSFCESFDVETMADVFMSEEPLTLESDDLSCRLVAGVDEASTLPSVCDPCVQPTTAETLENALQIGWSDHRPEEPLVAMPCDESNWLWGVSTDPMDCPAASLSMETESCQEELIKVEPTPVLVAADNSSMNSSAVLNGVDAPANLEEPTQLLPQETLGQLLDEDVAQWTMVTRTNEATPTRVASPSSQRTSWLGVEATEMSELLLMA